MVQQTGASNTLSQSSRSYHHGMLYYVRSKQGQKPQITTVNLTQV